MANLLLLALISFFLGRIGLAPLTSIAGEEFAFGLPEAAGRTMRVPARTTASVGMVTTARAAVVTDAETGAPLYEKDADAPLPLASITKLMTALVALDAKPDWDARVTMVSYDFVSGGTDRLHPGDQLTARELFGLSLVASENNATRALMRAVHLGEADFVARMNARARALHLDTATFVEPTGLDERNRASAKDVAWLLRVALARVEIRNTVGQTEAAYTIGGKTRYAPSTDNLVRTFLNQSPYRIVGGKTGSLDAHQYNLALEVMHELGGEAIVVVLGSETPESRFQDAKALATWVFANFSWR